ncbi:MAG: hypothetical protein EOP53_01690 [Sphingobacteriales bacterium]|nr:MAG: hypothetical protein EOP53_01690 [Sphingobacteriales bacterium]
MSEFIIKTKLVVQEPDDDSEPILVTEDAQFIREFLNYKTDDGYGSDLFVGKKIIIEDEEFEIKGIEVDFGNPDTQIRTYNCTITVLV